MGRPSFIFWWDHTATRSDLMICDKYCYNQNGPAYFHPRLARVMISMKPSDKWSGDVVGVWSVVEADAGWERARRPSTILAPTTASNNLTLISHITLSYVILHYLMLPYAIWFLILCCLMLSYVILHYLMLSYSILRYLRVNLMLSYSIFRYLMLSYV